MYTPTDGMETGDTLTVEYKSVRGNHPVKEVELTLTDVGPSAAYGENGDAEYRVDSEGDLSKADTYGNYRAVGVVREVSHA